MKKYDRVIGLEIHVELATKSKIFCGCKTDFGGKVNTHVCPVCTGMPGTLPVLNKKVLEYAMAVGISTNCSITRFSRFDRKNYMYPDNPQNYQISQLYMPICRDGYLECNGKKIGISEIHMEEDAGKIVHDDERNISLIDYNRAGVPLIEIVTKPDMSSSEEVIEFLEKLKDIISYLEVSDCKLNEGSMRVDVNLSVRESGSEILGTRTEMKNLNSFKAISRAIDHETKRQIEVIKSGNKVIMETRRWDDNKGESYSMRSKETVNDYRYFPEPDIPPLVIENEWIENIKNGIPELREDKINRYENEYKLPQYNARVITEHKKVAKMFEELVRLGIKPKKASNWIMVDLYKIINDRSDDASKIEIDVNSFAKIIDLVENNKITKNSGIEVLEALYDKKIDGNVGEYIEKNNLEIIDNTNELLKVIDEIFENNKQSIIDYKNGKLKAKGYLVGQTMKAMKGKANPSIVNELIEEKLTKYSNFLDF